MLLTYSIVRVRNARQIFHVIEVRTQDAFLMQLVRAVDKRLLEQGIFVLNLVVCVSDVTLNSVLQC